MCEKQIRSLSWLKWILYRKIGDNHFKVKHFMRGVNEDNSAKNSSERAGVFIVIFNIYLFI